MGMFDTLVFPRPIACSGCGKPITSTQTHEFGETLDTYRVGDVVAPCPIATGVLEESLYCDACRGGDRKVYITIWHSLITGVHESREEAEALLFQVDRADILNHLMAHQKEERRLGRLLRSALRQVSDYAEYLEAPDKAAFMAEPFRGIFRRDLEEHLKSPYPLSSIVARLRTEMGRAADEGSPFE